MKYFYYLQKLFCSVPQKELFRNRAQVKWQQHNTVWNLFPIVTQMNRESEYGSKLAKHISLESKFVICQKLVVMSFFTVLSWDMVSRLHLYCQGPKTEHDRNLKWWVKSLKRTSFSLLEFWFSSASHTFLLWLDEEDRYIWNILKTG